MKTFFVLLCLMACAAPVNGAPPVHTHPPLGCESPVRPVDDHNDALWQRFLAEIEVFQACVNEQMAWHQAAALDHQAKARAVVELWNQFVTSSLNAPEDFPGPLEE